MPLDINAEIGDIVLSLNEARAKMRKIATAAAKLKGTRLADRLNELVVSYNEELKTIDMTLDEDLIQLRDECGSDAELKVVAPLAPDFQS